MNGAPSQIPACDGDAGFALVIVLALMVLLAVVSAILVGSVRMHIRAAREYAAEAQARVLAESGIASAIADLRRNWTKYLVGGMQRRSQEPVLCGFGDRGAVALRVADAGGRVDLNTAQVPLFEALFTGLGLEAGAARDIAASIEAYRADKNSAVKRPTLKVDPAPAAFDTEEAIVKVGGITTQMARALTPYVTVHSGIRGLDPLSADPKLLNLLGVNAETDLPSNMQGASTHQTFIISAVARGAEGGVHGQEAVVRMSRDRRYPMGVEIRSWRPAVFSPNTSPPRQAETVLCTTDGLFSPR